MAAGRRGSKRRASISSRRSGAASPALSSANGALVVRPTMRSAGVRTYRRTRASPASASASVSTASAPTVAPASPTFFHPVGSSVGLIQTSTVSSAVRVVVQVTVSAPVQRSPEAGAVIATASGSWRTFENSQSCISPFRNHGPHGPCPTVGSLQ